MKSKSFMDEDWTGFSKNQIRSQIVAEIEEQQCNSEGHQWVPAFYCQNCGLRSEDALKEMTKKFNKKRKT